MRLMPKDFEYRSKVYTSIRNARSQGLDSISLNDLGLSSTSARKKFVLDLLLEDLVDSGFVDRFVDSIIYFTPSKTTNEVQPNHA